MTKIGTEVARRLDKRWREHESGQEWLSSSQAVEGIRAHVKASQTVGFVSGNFNVVHPGHLRLLKFASENCDTLVVGLNPDGPHEITVPARMRLEALEAIKMVDHVVLLDQPLAEFIRNLQPDIVVKGNEHKEHENVEDAVVEEYGGRLIFSSGDVTFSSLGLLQQELTRPQRLQTVKPQDFMTRHGFSLQDLRATLSKFSGLRVTVIGDLILDAYISCEPVGMSQEDPTIVVTPMEERLFVGGAGIVASHARGMGAEVRYMTVVGQDQRSDFALEELNAAGVQTHLLVDPTRPTTLKQRFRAHGKTLLRVNDLRQHSIDGDLIEALLKRFDDIADKTDLLLFSDFNYGCLPQPLVDGLIQRGLDKKIMMAADSQASSQYADISRFKHMTLVTPTERETRLAIRDFESGLAIAAEKLQDAAMAEYVVVTLGGEGLMIRCRKDRDPHTDRLPVFNAAPVDVAGAGDSLFTSCSMAMCVGASPWQSVYLGSIAAGCQVSRIGNKPLHVEELLGELFNTPV
ncbi:PfkB family carbohydrate kinase [Rhodospirillum sp. A1_3_36]|uniref:PfkB family carbohydrate kinase n=1 Tax=Rhodospirillum sp. A1_3_36 TaxID=3391666 RepID=UPI0039A75157